MTNYSLNFQCQVAKFSPTCCLKNSHQNDIELFRQNLEELWEKQIKLFTFLHFSFLSNDAVNAVIMLESLENSEQEDIGIFWWDLGVPKI